MILIKSLIVEPIHQESFGLRPVMQGSCDWAPTSHRLMLRQTSSGAISDCVIRGEPPSPLQNSGLFSHVYAKEMWSGTKVWGAQGFPSNSRRLTLRQTSSGAISDCVIRGEPHRNACYRKRFNGFPPYPLHD